MKTTTDSLYFRLVSADGFSPEEASNIVRAMGVHEELMQFVRDVKRVADDGMLTPEWSSTAKRLLAKAKAVI